MPTDPRVRLDAIRQRLANADAERLREDEHHRRYPTSRWRATTHEYELQKHAPADLAATVSALEAVLHVAEDVTALHNHPQTFISDSCATCWAENLRGIIADALGGGGGVCLDARRNAMDGTGEQK